ncbi:Crp/Fnr family transcriptional regulator [Tractidigestivibacter sp.]|uniref:Crp/Fnr family transcriptional regulator n=1 Tax=Tractidigestivibacter sp. TaxID=2847320 RepID=UPI002A7F76A8|nr:Crp/Fnr family transcriptional regulator [Tractidigestivibacter sp.]MDD7584331.1 Crp/Fnr family transcriptional regulator [Coriobacteriaceae bacterium]MDY4533754.1 Crp/Fnr family transcriptional regulator [Tractidigestivibacter sp.]MDY5272308.1 Crp/Fnr family transcriptional regulator [Tractidigestivibacter sp.]
MITTFLDFEWCDMRGVDAEFLCKTALFQGVTPQEVTEMLGCLAARPKTYEKGELVWVEGGPVTSVGVVLEGAVRVEGADVWGNASVMGSFSAGELFGEAFAALPEEPLLTNVVAAKSPTRVLFIDVTHVMHSCPRACACHARVAENLLTSVARKNVRLTRRIRDAAPKSIRGKLLAYLSTQSKLAGSNEFDIPFTRQQLADYLGVDRCALCSAIGRLEREGKLAANRHHFSLPEVATGR